MPPARATRAILRVDDFSFGDYGTLAPWKAPRGSFSGQNVLRSRAGRLHPAPKPKEYTITGKPNGVLNGMGLGYANSGGVDLVVWCVVGQNVYAFNADSVASQAIVTYAGATSATAMDYQFVAAQDFVGGIARQYIGNSNRGLYRIDHVADTTTSIDTALATYDIARYGERMVLCSANRIRYSAAANPATWPALNFIDVGGTNAIAAVREQRGNLVTPKFNDDIWVMTGVPGVNDVLRKVSSEIAGLRPWAHTLLANDLLAFMQHSTRRPGFFTGSGVLIHEHITLSDVMTDVDVYTGSELSPDFAMQRLRSGGDLVCVTNPVIQDIGWVHREKAWFKQVPGIGQVGAWLDAADFKDLIVLGSDGTGSTPPKFYAWQAYLERPPFNADALSTFHTRTDVFFSLPQHVEESSEVAVRAVMVDFLKYEHSIAGQTNHFDVEVKSVRRTDGDRTLASDGAFDEVSASGSTAGTRDRKAFTFAQEWGQGFEVKVKDIFGVAIEAPITVVYDRRPLQGF